MSKKPDLLNYYNEIATQLRTAALHVLRTVVGEEKFASAKLEFALQDGGAAYEPVDSKHLQEPPCTFQQFVDAPLGTRR